MKTLRVPLLLVLMSFFLLQCRPDPEITLEQEADFSGTYCLNLFNLEISLTQTAESVTFVVSSDLLTDGAGVVQEGVLHLQAAAPGSAVFNAALTLSENGHGFSGPFDVTDPDGSQALAGTLLGEPGECPEYEIASGGLPQFIQHDMTNVAKIEQVSKFRSGFGHSYTDGVEACRSMKHYFQPYEQFRQNQAVEVYAPVTGKIIMVMDDGHGASIGLNNKQIQIRPDDQPAFTLELFHVDLLSAEIETGKAVEAGELLGYARLFYDDLGEQATSFDIAVWVNTPVGLRLVSYFDLLSDEVLSSYLARGVSSRADFILSQEDRDADPIACEGDSFSSPGHLENWVFLP